MSPYEIFSRTVRAAFPHTALHNNIYSCKLRIEIKISLGIYHRIIIQHLLESLPVVAFLLTSAVHLTSQHPRLANGGSLRLTVWDFHPLNQSPFSGRAYPFTAPIVIPCTKYFCTNGYTQIMGNEVSTIVADFNVACTLLASAVEPMST